MKAKVLAKRLLRLGQLHSAWQAYHEQMSQQLVVPLPKSSPGLPRRFFQRRRLSMSLAGTASGLVAFVAWGRRCAAC